MRLPFVTPHLTHSLVVVPLLIVRIHLFGCWCVFRSHFLSFSFLIALIPFTQYTLAVWCKSVMKLGRNNLLVPRTHGHSREIEKKKQYLSHLSDCIMSVVSFFYNNWLSLQATVSCRWYKIWNTILWRIIQRIFHSSSLNNEHFVLGSNKNLE